MKSFRHYVKRVKEISEEYKKYLCDYSYNKSCRKRLRNSDFTIISCNCMGGILYHRYGMEFKSPTVNLFFQPKEFVIFCENLEKYIEKGKLIFIETDKVYPVAKLQCEELAEIRIDFMHYLTTEQAERSWYKRCKRINYDNLFIIGSDVGLDRDDILRLVKVKSRRTVVFTSGNYNDIPNTFVLEKRKGMKDVGKFINDIDHKTGIRYVEEVFDFVDFFNGL